MNEAKERQVGNTIELIILYEADAAGAFARIRSDGRLVEFRVNGQVAKPPTSELNELYRWLQDRGLKPDMSQFQWLDRNQGHRRRRQVYVHETRDHIPERRLTHKQAWDVARGYSLGEL